MKNRLIIIGADFSANALIGQIDTSYSLRVDVESVEVSRTTPATIYATSELQTFNDDVYVGSTPAPISVSTTGGLIAAVGAPEGNVYPITLDASAVTQEQCEITITQIGTSNSATVVATAQIYAIKRSTNAPLMDVVYAQGWSASPDYMTFDEAAKVQRFNNVFIGNTDIVQFPELQSFTGLVSLYGASIVLSSFGVLKGCANLSGDIVLAEGLNLESAQGAFEGTQIRTVTIRNSVIQYSLASFGRGVKTLEWVDLTGTDTSQITKYGGVTLYEYVTFDSPVFTKLLGYLDFASATVMSNFVSTACTNLRRLHIKNLGKQASYSGSTDVLARLPLWGVPDPNDPDTADARERMVDTLLNDSFDRASAGYSALNISLHANTKALLTDEEKAAITAKGITIS